MMAETGRRRERASAPAATTGAPERGAIGARDRRRAAVTPQAREIGAQLARALVAQVAILLERLVEDAVRALRASPD